MIMIVIWKKLWIIIRNCLWSWLAEDKDWNLNVSSNKLFRWMSCLYFQQFLKEKKTIFTSINMPIQINYQNLETSKKKDFWPQSRNGLAHLPWEEVNETFGSPPFPPPICTPCEVAVFWFKLAVALQTNTRINQLTKEMEIDQRPGVLICFSSITWDCEGI